MKSFAVIILCFFMILLIGCHEFKQEASQILYEDAVIEKVFFHPSELMPVVEPSFGGGDSGIGFGPSGVGLKIGSGLQISEETIPAKFEVIFKLKSISIAIDDKEFYEKFKNHQGKTVNVAYRKIYQVEYDKNKYKEKYVVSRKLVDHQFVNATFK